MPIGAIGSNTIGGTAAPKDGSQLGKTEFLNLLVAQLKHQDPLQPMDNMQFVAQLAQFSNVEQLVSVNEGINMLGQQQMGMANAQAAALIGKDVEIRSDKFSVQDKDTSAATAFTLEDDAAEVSVSFRDASGAVVRTINLGPQKKGEVAAEWDLKNDNGSPVPPGTYRLDVTATNEAGETIHYDPKIRGTVTGVNYDAGYPQLVVDSIRADLSNIIAIYPGDTP